MKVQFNLEATSVHKYEGEKEEDAPPSNRTWYSRRELRSFQISTHRSVVSYQDRVNQAGAAGGDAFFAGLDDDDVCVQGIEILVSSPTIRRSLVSSHVLYMSLTSLSNIPIVYKTFRLTHHPP